MTIIPLDLERTFERRWAARFFSPVVSAPSKRHRPESGNRLTRPAKAKEKPAWNRRAPIAPRRLSRKAAGEGLAGCDGQ
jgi:hypothetical protein